MSRDVLSIIKTFLSRIENVHTTIAKKTHYVTKLDSCVITITSSKYQMEEVNKGQPIPDENY